MGGVLTLPFLFSPSLNVFFSQPGQRIIGLGSALVPPSGECHSELSPGFPNTAHHTAAAAAPQLTCCTMITLHRIHMNECFIHERFI